MVAMWALMAAASSARSARRFLVALAAIRVPGARRALGWALGTSATTVQAFIGPGVAHASTSSGASTAAPIMRYVGQDIDSGRANPHATTAHVWVVRPGDDLWSISATVFARDGPQDASPCHVAAYWWHVVQVNRAHLPDPSDANLLYPGDLVYLPPVPRQAD